MLLNPNLKKKEIIIQLRKDYILWKKKRRVQLNFNEGHAGQRLKIELLRFRPDNVKIVQKNPDISLEFLVGNPYIENRTNIIERVEKERILFLSWKCLNYWRENWA